MQKFIVRVESEEKRFSDKMDGGCYALNAALDEEYCREFVEKAAAESRIVLFYGEGAVKTGLFWTWASRGLKKKWRQCEKNWAKAA